MHTRGFTIFFAVLVASLALGVGLAIYDLLIRELDLSQTATQSQYAIYAADAGAECALYWDSKYNTNESAFGTSTTDTWGSAITCYGQDVSAFGIPPNPFGVPPTGWSAWDTIADTDAATTTFYILLGTTASKPCAMVQVGKSGNPSQTTITSRGYNTCVEGGVQRLERALQVSY